LTVRVLHVIPSFWPAVRYGGPIVSVRRLCGALAGRGVDVDVATTNADGRGDLDVSTDRWVELDGFRVCYFRRWPRCDYAWSPSLRSYLATHVRSYDLVHVTSTFSYPSLAAGRAARCAGVPYVVSPRGSLQPWSLAQKRWKKVPYWALFEKRHLERAARLHATAEIEEQQIHIAVPRARVFVAPNGADAPEGIAFERQARRIVFLGRIHPKKGFDVLIPALAELARTNPDVVTIVAGPDDVGEWSHVEARLGDARPRPDVRWIGPVDGAAKWELLTSARVFVLPSHSENFGQAVIEALASGTPVVVSRGCPWRSVQERGAGAWVENRPDALAAALREILDADGRRYGAMQDAARALAAEFSWPAIAANLEREYRCILAERGTPA
jgi:glycosyltransferase involved in cell wall biosynthesis